MARKRRTPKPESQVLGVSSPTTSTSNPNKPSSSEPQPKREKHPVGRSTADSTSGPPVYFWSETDALRGYLSQWYPMVPFYDPSDSELKVYRTAEHYMMHHKALLFGDIATGAEILKAGHPREVKALGRVVQGFTEALWTANREIIVRRASWCKFTCPVEDGNAGLDAGMRVWKLGKCSDAKEVECDSFRTVLLNTGTRELIEASPYDRIWGIGYTEADAEQNRKAWGLNLLGKALMAVREEFRDDEVAVEKTGPRGT